MRPLVASAVFNNAYLVRAIKERVEAVRKSSFGKSCERALREIHIIPKPRLPDSLRSERLKA